MIRKICSTAIMLFLSVGILAGCSMIKKDSESSKNLTTVNDIKADASFGDDMMVIDEVDEATGKSIIKYVDSASNEAVYACGLKNCNHNSEGNNSDNCNAIFDGNIEYPFLFQDKLYYFVCNDKWVFYESKYDGEGKKKIAELQFEPDYGNIIFREGKLYITSHHSNAGEEDENGVEMVSSENSELYELDVKTGEQKQLTSFGQKAAINRKVMIEKDNKIYLSMLYQNKNIYQSEFKTYEKYQEWLMTEENTYQKSIEIFDRHEVYYCVNLENGSVEEVSFNYQINYEGMENIEGLYDFYMLEMNDKYCYYVTAYGVGYTLYKYDLENETSEVLDSSYRMTYAYNDGKIYIEKVTYDENKEVGALDSVDTSIPPEYVCYDTENNKWIDIKLNANITGKEFMIESASDRYLYGYLRDFDENGISEMGILAAIEVTENK